MWPFHLPYSPKNRTVRRATRRLQRAGRPRRAAVRLGLEPLEERWLLNATITVTTTQDDPSTPIPNQTTLRDAINDANANPGSTIIFNIPTNDPGYQNGVWTMQPMTNLPAITGTGTTIDGKQGGLEGQGPVIVLDGSQAGTFSGDGLEVNANGVAIEDLDIINWGNGIEIDLRVSGTSVTGNFIGIKADGKTAAGNGNGVLVDSDATATTIGGGASPTETPTETTSSATVT
jgi:hypothetical protein